MRSKGQHSRRELSSAGNTDQFYGGAWHKYFNQGNYTQQRPNVDQAKRHTEEPDLGLDLGGTYSER